MIKLIKPVFYFSVFCATQLSAMLDPQSLQLLPQDTFGVVTYHCTLQSLGRLKTTNKHFNGNVDIDIRNIIKSPLYYGFQSVEKYLYHHAPKLMQMQDGDDKQKLQQLLSGIIAAHVNKIDPVIFDIYGEIKRGDWSNFFVATAELKLDDEKRLLFYCGKLPGKMLEGGDRALINQSEFVENDPMWDIIEAAQSDAIIASNDKNIPRLKVILDRYEQFRKGPQGLLGNLCNLKGCSDLVINYISLPERGIEYEESGFDACDFAAACYNDQLIEDLNIWISNQED